MSSTTVLGVVPNQRPMELAEFRNAWGWAPSIWRRLCDGNGLGDYWLHNNESLERLWESIDELPEWQQAPLVLTFDTGVIPCQAFGWAADQLEEFDRRLPAPEGHANHVPAMVELLRSMPEVPLLGVWVTSVTDNPFDPWDEELDAPGSGIPLYGAMYVLERHRHFLPPPTAEDRERGWCA